MRVKSHQLPITMRMAMEFTEDSPPTGGQQNGLVLGFCSSLHPPTPARNALAPPPPPGLGKHHWSWGGEQGSEFLASYRGL